ncbi:unnamed protein product [Mycena citricolor]|uniref:Alpha-ketoglutarate-dependent dioxygenase AlkB-like domain-containing protein n=1 Tax=Mycena citricolor TaxID=2018698 RepID=A0AAD2HAE0_9AGAR|nr:unnamed protein product [Mycena citricolor]
MITTTTMSASERFDLSSYRIPGSDSCFYIPEFITEGEEAYLIRKVAPGFRPALGPQYLRERSSDSRFPSPAVEAAGQSQAPAVGRRINVEQRPRRPADALIRGNLVSVYSPPPPSPGAALRFTSLATSPDIINRLQQTGVFHGSPHAKPNHIIMSLVPSTDPSQTHADDSPGTKFVPCLLCVVEILPRYGTLGWLPASILSDCPARRDHGRPCLPPPSMSNRQLQPHEDGPAYHPAVATISLNSHCVFHYYRYTLPESHGGRSIDPTPVLSLLLEPRSVVISTDSLYSNHLHSIHEIKEDRFTAGGVADFGSPIANWERVTDAATREVLANGGALTRGTRYSLTCRDVGKVAQLKSFVKR